MSTGRFGDLTRKGSLALAIAMVVGGSALATADDGGVSGGAQEVGADRYASADSRWLPWLGCWELTFESVDYEDVGPARDALVCLTPRTEDAGVDIATIVEGEPVLKEMLVADGVRRSVEETGCRGWQVNEWSRDASRLFVRSEMSCDGGVERSLSGMTMMVPGRTWVDIQVVGAEDQREVVIRRYRRAGAEAIEKTGIQGLPVDESVAGSTARLAIARRLTMDDVIEATGKVDPEAVEAALMESDSRFELDGNSLLRLADSDVPDGVIDLMVALSYPEYFSINREGVEEERTEQGGAYVPVYAGIGPYYYDYWYYDYAPFGYPYWYSYDYGPYYRSPGIRYQGISGGRVVKGRGYTRVEREGRSDSIVGRGLDLFRGGGSRSGGSSSGSSSGGSAGKGGYTKSGSSSGRTAKPRKK